MMNIRENLVYFKMIMPYVLNCMRRSRRTLGNPKHLIFLFVDHFEPGKNKKRVEDWLEKYSQMVANILDSDGRCPQHTWFYPCDQLDIQNLKKLSKASFEGYGEIEMHLHHNNDTSDSLRSKIAEACRAYAKVGALVNHKDSSYNYGFIHGNWALDNSRDSSSGRFCGVNDELTILKNLGCYADFTFPSYELSSQPWQINSLYYAKDDPNEPKSYNRGKLVTSGRTPNNNLLMVQGPWVLNWSRRKYGILPYVEYGDVSAYYPPFGKRIKLWMRANVHVQGNPDWVFVKIHTHGAHKIHMPFVLGDGMKEIHQCLLTECCNDDIQLHYVTARECYNIIKAAEAGENGNPNTYRDFLIPKPSNKLICSSALYDLEITSNGVEVVFPKIEKIKISVLLGGSHRVEISSDGLVSLMLKNSSDTYINCTIIGKTIIESKKHLDIDGDVSVVSIVRETNGIHYELLPTNTT